MGCSFKTNPLSSFTGHTSRNHKNHKLRGFLTHIRVVSDFQSNDTDQTCNADPEAGCSSASCPGLDSTEKSELDFVQNVDSEIFEHRLASLFLRMQCLLHVSKNAIQAIIDEFNDILSLSKFHATDILKEVFAKYNIEVEEKVIQEISIIQLKKVHYQQIIGETNISGSISLSLNQLSYCMTGLQEKFLFMFL